MVLFTALVLLAFSQFRFPELRPFELSEGSREVEFVVDGDTIQFRGQMRVRLIGVNTPETVKPNHPVEPCGPEATEFTRRFLAGGRAHLRFDAERIDRYGRILAYLSVGDRLLNEELLRAGLARYEPQYHYSQTMHRRFRLAEQAAKADRIGIWAEPPCGGDVTSQPRPNSEGENVEATP